MGSGSSRIDTDDVRRCKARKDHMKQAVSHRNRFAAAHANYLVSLKSTGAAINQFSELVVSSPSVSETVKKITPVLPPAPVVKEPPPPPLEVQPPEPQEESGEDTEDDDDFAATQTLHRAASMPAELASSLAKSQPPLPTVKGSYPKPEQPLPITTKPTGTETLNAKNPAQVMMPVDSRKVEQESEKRTPQQIIDFVKCLKEIDEIFIKCCHAGSVVSKLLEVQRTYYHTPITFGIKGMEDHRQRVSRVLSWTKESNAIGDKNNHETLASTLDKLYAWEKKLYDEIRTCEATRLEAEKKKANHLKRKAYKDIVTKLNVEFEVVDSAVNEVFRLRDEHLIPELVELIKQLRGMWITMTNHHKTQATYAANLITHEPVPKHKRSTEFCKKVTEQLNIEIGNWHSSLEEILNAQRDCLQSILDWEYKIDKRENPSATKLDEICKKWLEVLAKLSPKDILSALADFSGKLEEMSRKQNQETDLELKIEEAQKELQRKKEILEKHTEKRRVTENNTEGYSSHYVDEKKTLIEIHERQIQDEKARYSKMCEENSTVVLFILQNNLPQVLNSIMSFSVQCRTRYEELCTDLSIL